MNRRERLSVRNQKLRAYFSALEEKHPQWKLTALLEETAKEFPPLSPSTVQAILKQTGIYTD